MVKKIFLLILWLLTGLNAENSVEAHIFIHGTRMSFLSLLSAIPTIKGTLKDQHLYTKIVKSSRNDSGYHDTQVLLGRGLTEVSNQLIKKCRQKKLEPCFSRKAAIQTINVYDILLAKDLSICHYYTFGWDGMLGDNYRRNDAYELYYELVNLREILQKKYPGKEVKFILHAHSHGGNVVLYLAYHEENEKKNLSIDLAVFYGAPIQVETAAFCQHPLFKIIINLYSEGDHIQVLDKISTSAHTSKRRLSELTDISKKPIIDVCISAESNQKAFGHASYFFIDMYQSNFTKKYHKIFQEIKFFPVVALAPLFIPLVKKGYAQSKCKNMILNFCKPNATTSIVQIHNYNKTLTLSSKNILPILTPLTQIIEQTWKPCATHTGTINLAMLAIFDAMKTAPTNFFTNKKAQTAQ